MADFAMTIEVKAESCVAIEEPVKVVVEEAEKVVEEVKSEKNEKVVEKCSSYREESNFLTDLKECEKKALSELKTKLEEAIIGNTLFKKEEKKESPKKASKVEKGCEKEVEKKEECEKVEEKKEGCEEVEKKEECEKVEEKKEECAEEAEKKEECEEEKPKECEKIEESEKKEQEPEAEVEVVDKDISIWGVPLLPSKGDEGTSVVLLKFLRAREFKVDQAFEMLKKTLKWRKEFKIDSILEEEFEADLSSAAYMSGVDCLGHPVCYNIFGVLDNGEVYEKTLATEEKREQFLRWRVQLMEKSVRALELKPGSICSLVQVNDLKNSPGAKKEVRAAVNKAVALLQDNYPEFVAKNVSFLRVTPP